MWCWLKEWQDLVAGLIGAAALVWTVRWTLLAERRRQEDEAKALRTALGAEVRQHAGSALAGYGRAVGMLSTGANVGSVVSVSSQQLANIARFPDPVVYPHTAARLGVLGDHAHGIVFFFGQLTLVQDTVRRLSIGEPVLTRAQLLNLAEALLNAAEAAVKALPAFAEARWVENDRAFASQVAEARASFERLRSAPAASAPTD